MPMCPCYCEGVWHIPMCPCDGAYLCVHVTRVCVVHAYVTRMGVWQMPVCPCTRVGIWACLHIYVHVTRVGIWHMPMCSCD